MGKEQYQLEYTLTKVAQDRLWRMISTELGLSEWITGDVYISPDDVVRFQWAEDDYDEAKMEVLTPGEHVRFHWITNDDYFDLSLRSTELTGDKTLVITDFATPSERASSVEIWQQQVSALRHCLGLGR